MACKKRTRTVIPISTHLFNVRFITNWTPIHIFYAILNDLSLRNLCFRWLFFLFVWNFFRSKLEMNKWKWRQLSSYLDPDTFCHIFSADFFVAVTRFFPFDLGHCTSNEKRWNFHLMREKVFMRLELWKWELNAHRIE